MRIIDKIIVHCADTFAHMDIGAKEIDRWHRERGWKAIGYNYVIRRDGTIEKGRDLDGDGNVDEEVGAHARGFNANSIGICLVGGKGEDGNPDANFTMLQYMALTTLKLKLLVKYPNADIMGHRDLDPSKDCPCFDVRAFIKGK